MGSSVMRWLRRGAVVSVLVAAFAYLPWCVYRSDGFVRYRRLERERAELDRANEASRRANHALHREIDRLRNDLAAVGAVARDELGLVGPDEIVVVVDRAAPPRGDPP